MGVGPRLYRTIWDNSGVLEPVKEGDGGAQKRQTPLHLPVAGGWEREASSGCSRAPSGEDPPTQR